MSQIKKPWRMKYRCASVLSGVVLMATVLSGCVASNHVGVRRDGHDRLTVLNCGRWIERVTARDADTLRTVWSAHVDRTSADTQGAYSVEIGAAPPHWTEDTRLDLSSRPSNWSISVESPKRETIIASERALRSGLVFRPGKNRSESLAHFDEQTCNGLPVPAALGILLAATIAVVCVGFAVYLRRRSRRLQLVNRSN